MGTMRQSRSRRWLKGTVAALSVVGLTGSLAACGGDADPEESRTIVATETGTDSDATPSELLAMASESTSAIESGRMRMTMEVEFEAMGESASSTIVADGAFAQAGRQSEMSMDMGAYLRDLAGDEAADIPSSMSMRMIIDGTLMYMKFDADPPEPGMESWYVTDLAQQAEDLGMDSSVLDQPAGFGGGPISYIEQLKGAGADVEATGTETIDGVEVTRYDGTIDPLVALDNADPDKRDELERMLDQTGMAGPMPFSAWVDDDGIVRRIRQEFSTDSELMSMRMVQVIDLYDLGEPVTITPPPPDQVRDASELADLQVATA